jgi:hypothetical protein
MRDGGERQMDHAGSNCVATYVHLSLSRTLTGLPPGARCGLALSTHAAAV